MTPEPVFVREPSATLYAMADGSAAVREAGGERLHAVNAEAAAILGAHERWSPDTLAQWLVGHGHAAREARAMSEAFLLQMVAISVLTPESRV